MELYKRAIVTDAVQGSKPIKYKGYLVPEYFFCTAYFYDNDGKKVTQNNAGNFKVWSVEILIRVTSVSTEEVIRSTIYGAKAFTGHPVLFSHDPRDDHRAYQPVKASYYKLIAENRARLMSYAITTAVQSFVYKKQKDGSHFWPPFSRREVSEEALQVLGKAGFNQAYIRKDHAFYQEVARIYKDTVIRGEWPNEVLMQIYGKQKTTVQGWTTECRKRGLLAQADKGKVSTVRQTVRKTRKGK